VLSLKRPLTTRDKAPIAFFLLHLGGMVWVLLSPPAYTTTTTTTTSSSPGFSWRAALTLAIAAGVGMGVVTLRALLYQPATRARALVRQGPFVAAGAQAALALLLLARLPW
jgi:hypothetical protein